MSRRMDFVRLAAERLGAALRQRDQVIVVPFNKQLGAITGPTNDAKTIGGRDCRDAARRAARRFWTAVREAPSCSRARKAGGR